jgi:hypothetical protein
MAYKPFWLGCAMASSSMHVPAVVWLAMLCAGGNQAWPFTWGAIDCLQKAESYFGEPTAR